ncbi:hypothetical protein E2C01_052876 [Portunus trituberculatus]|uniref:Uncharacterized protein n=1 Tax=Portunus trituberculatus TaxID=210409 RepID=A0A5B7GMZ5_PORTR|nr:hypothetical protein [Portunus trituberculatus]
MYRAACKGPLILTAANSLVTLKEDGWEVTTIWPPCKCRPAEDPRLNTIKATVPWKKEGKSLLEERGAERKGRILCTTLGLAAQTKEASTRRSTKGQLECARPITSPGSGRAMACASARGNYVGSRKQPS